MNTKKRTWFFPFLIVFFAPWQYSDSHAALYKCDIGGKIEYSQFPCPSESSDSEQLGQKTSDAELSRNSIHGEIKEVINIDEFWRCQTIKEAYEYLPSAYSIGQLWFDFSKVSTDLLENISKVKYRDSSIKARLKLKQNKSYRPYCRAEGTRSIRKDKTNFHLKIYAHENIPDTDVIPTLAEILSLLKNNGYDMQKTDDNHYASKWEFWDSRCRANLTARLNSQQVLKGTVLSVSCYTKKKPKQSIE